ncbi:unnamed protein product [Durusdinium trenchii]|uniref:Uncharacterized protein n=1 Tax=Durusdinium trenchii TaxID=1381693 RepID=A0ABP0KJ83_9DINO
MLDLKRKRTETEGLHGLILGRLGRGLPPLRQASVALVASLPEAKVHDGLGAAAPLVHSPVAGKTLFNVAFLFPPSRALVHRDLETGSAQTASDGSSFEPRIRSAGAPSSTSLRLMEKKQIPPPSRSWQTEKTNGKALEGDGDGRCQGRDQGEASVTFQHQEIEVEPDITLQKALRKELRAALRSCSSIQVLDATLTAARGKGRCPRESRRILKVLNAFWHSQGRRRRRSAMKLMSQATVTGRASPLRFG